MLIHYSTDNQLSAIARLVRASFVIALVLIAPFEVKAGLWGTGHSSVAKGESAEDFEPNGAVAGATWNVSSGNWSNASNWTGGNVPNNGNNGIPTYNAAIFNGGTATLDQNITLENFTLSSGALTGSSNLTLNKNLVWTSGVMSGTGTTSVAGTSSLSSGIVLARTLQNSGAMNFAADNGQFTFGYPTQTVAILNNTASGTFNLTSGGDFVSTIVTPGHTINNAGTWNVSGAGKTSTVSFFVAFNNTGLVNVSSGTFSIQGGGTNSGTFSVASGAALEFAGGVGQTTNFNSGTDINGAGSVKILGGAWNLNAGSYTVLGSTTVSGGATFNVAVSLPSFDITNSGSSFFNSPATLGVLNLSGTLGGSATVTVPGDVAWNGGGMRGAGTTIVSGTTNINPSLNVELDRTLQNNGVMNFTTADGAFYLGTLANSIGTLNNAAGATLNVTAGGDFSGGTGTINNAGTWNVSGAGTQSQISQSVTFNNTGLLNINGAAFLLSGGGASTGKFDVATGGTLGFALGTYNFEAGTIVTGLGSLQTSGATVNFNAGQYDIARTSLSLGVLNFNSAANISQLDIAGGTAGINSAVNVDSVHFSYGNVTGSAALNVIGNLIWNGGTMSGTGTTSVTGANSMFEQNNSTGAFLSLGRTLQNSGTINFTFGQVLFGPTADSPGILNNTASGIFSVTQGGDFSANIDNPAHAINNAGIWNVSGVGMTSIVGPGIAFNNSGTLNASSGSLAFRGAFTQTAGSINLNGGSVSTTSALNIQGGVLRGSGTITGNVNNAAQISPGFSAGRIDITGDLSLNSSSNLVFEVGGTGQGTQYDFLMEGGNLALNLDGTISIVLIDGFDPSGQTFTLISSNTNLGTGQFLNAPPGSRILTTDGSGSFQITYGPDGNNVVLNDFTVVPEPSTTALLSVSLAGFLAFVRRKSRLLSRCSCMPTTQTSSSKLPRRANLRTSTSTRVKKNPAVDAWHDG